MVESSANEDALTIGKAGKFMFRQWARHRIYFPVALALSTAAAVCELLVPWAVGAVVNSLAANTTTPWTVWIALIGLYAGAGTLRSLLLLLQARYRSRNISGIADDAFSHVLSLSSRWHAENHVGGTVSTITRGMRAYEILEEVLLGRAGASILGLFGLTISIALKWPLVGLICAVAIAATAAFLIIGTAKYLAPPAAYHAVVSRGLASSLTDSLASNAEVKSFAREREEAQRLERDTKALYDITRKTAKIRAVLNLGQTILLTALLATLSAALLLTADASTKAGDLAFAITAFMIMASQVQAIAYGFQSSQEGIALAGEISNIHAVMPEVMDTPRAKDTQAVNGPIEFRDVSFRYAPDLPSIFEDLSLRVGRGEHVALVGATGSGKSTIVRLLQRLYNLDQGSVLLDGVDITSVTQRALRNSIALVPQDTVLFHRTIGENIRFGRPDADDEAIVEAARKARAHDFITRLPQGYATVVGERGVKLSGGERQRLAIARAFLADAPILILDEASSSLDVETEALVQEAIELLIAGKTTISIAHRLSTIRKAHRILVFDEGKIVEEGNHSKLIEQAGHYARLASRAFSET